MLYCLLLHPTSFNSPEPMCQTALQLAKKNLKYILIALICGLILVFYIRFDQVALSTDDDVQLNLIASGAFGPHSQYLIYINILYGWFLKLLYTAIPSVNWYLFTGLFLNLCAAVSICFLFCRNLRTLPSVPVTLLCMLFFSKDFFLSTQFTSNVFLYAAAGYCWLLYAFKHGKKAALVPAAFFILLSSMARAAAFLMTMPFIAVALFAHVTLQSGREKDLRQFVGKLLPVFGIFAAAVLLIGVDTVAYERKPDWAYFQKRLEALTEIEDRGSVDYLNHRELYDEAGFPMETVTLITNWLDNDPEVYSLEQLQKMADVKRSYNTISFRLEWRILVEAVHNVFTRFFYGQHWLPWLYIGSIFAWMLLHDKKRLWLVLLQSAVIVVLYYALICYGRLGWHVEIGIWLLALLLPFADRLTDEQTAVLPAGYPAGDRRLHLASVAMISVLMLLCASAVVRNPQGARLVTAPSTVKEAALTHKVLEYICANKNRFYIVSSPLSRGYWGAETVYDLNYTHSDDFENVCWLGGWFSGSPIGFYRAHEAGFSNPLRALFERENTFLIATESEADMIIYYLVANYREDIIYHLVYEVEGYGVWQFRTL